MAGARFFIQGKNMPILNVQIMQGHDSERKRDFLRATSDAVVSSVGVPLKSVRVLIDEVPSDNVIVAGEVGVDVVLIRVLMISGRTEQAKAALIAALTQASVRALGIDADQVRVVLFDVPATDMGMAGGVTAKSMGR